MGRFSTVLASPNLLACGHGRHLHLRLSGENQVAVHREVLALAEGHLRAHAFQLLRDHAAAATVEVWRDESVWEVLARDGVRAIRTAPPAKPVTLKAAPADTPSRHSDP